MKRTGLSEMKLLVTGAGGFIGSHLCELVIEQGARVRALACCSPRNDRVMFEDPGSAKLKETEILSGDLRDTEAVRRAIRDRGVHGFWNENHDSMV